MTSDDDDDNNGNAMRMHQLPTTTSDDDEQPANNNKKKIYHIRYLHLFLILLASLLAILLVALAVGLSVRAATCDDDNGDAALARKAKPPKRLPRSVWPELYRVELRPVFEPDFRFDGTVSIDMRVRDESVNRVVLHARNLELDELRLVRSDSDDEIPLKAWKIEDGEILAIELPSYLETDVGYRLSMRFRGNLTDNLAGVYRSSFRRSDGSLSWLMASQMSPTDARGAFPCFDEPEFKAVFETTLVRPASMRSISNTHIVESEERPDGYVADRYAPTPIMSTYVTAFVVAEFLAEELQADNGVLQRFWARPDAMEQLGFAKEIAGPLLGFYEEYFNVTYEMEKLDHVAVPDFRPGAMENWGAILYRQSRLLFDANAMSISDQQYIALTIAHEISHQWFGNLATPRWWNDLWLKEGFAVFAEFVGTDYVRPQWRIFDTLLIDKQDTLLLDMLGSSRPLSTPVAQSGDICSSFDSIAYTKGPALIHMVNHFLGSTRFRASLNDYLLTHAFGNADRDDLWSAFTRHADGVDVRRVMHSWTTQSGFPLVTIERNYTSNALSIGQRRFLVNPDDDDSAGAAAAIWHVPLTIVGRSDRLDVEELEASSSEVIVWLRKSNDVVHVERLQPDDWFIGNALAAGYFRVNYDERNWRRIARQLQSDRQRIDARSRAQLIDDALNIARAGHLDYRLALPLLETLDADDDYVVWKSALSAAGYIDAMLRSTEYYGAWRQFMLERLSPALAKLEWPTRTDKGRSAQARLLAKLIIGKACRYGHVDCVETARRQFDAWRADPENNRIAPDLRTIVYCSAVRVDDQPPGAWDFLWRFYKDAKSDAGHARKLLAAMSCSHETWILQRYLVRSLNDSLISRSDAPMAVSYAADSSAISRPIAWEFFRDNWSTTLRERYSDALFVLPRMIEYLLAEASQPSDLREAEEFYRQHGDELGCGRRALEQGLERIRANIAWSKRNLPIVGRWLTDRVKPVENAF